MTDQPSFRASPATEEAVRSAVDLAEQYGGLLGRDVQDAFMNSDIHMDRVEALRIALIEAAEGLHPSRSLAGLAEALAPWIERGMGLK
ncbi:hypothetical protein J2X16_000790 [Pelomonas aquatica]|uniref:Uncharacterized protein n=1 Tax=Pelomonas aquatica TaxID=431058 RepID=A0ABU1Z4D7_9BURK|nr:hypothetical protein [Pelomonas aquatica]MDR7295469.1 hypothetical protein [Pelomonas aquatica]